MKTSFLISFIFIFICCGRRTTTNSINYNSVSKKIFEMGKKYETFPIEFPFTVLENKDFQNIQDSIILYKPYLLQVLRDNTKSKNDKLIALFALQHLCINDYMIVLETVYSEYKLNKLDKYFLNTAINQAGLSLEVYRNISNKKLLEILHDIKVNVPNIDNIDLILSGKMWENLINYYKNSGEPTPWYCK